MPLHTLRLPTMVVMLLLPPPVALVEQLFWPVLFKKDLSTMEVMRSEPTKLGRPCLQPRRITSSTTVLARPLPMACRLPQGHAMVSVSIALADSK